MALVINDRVKETTTTTGTGAVALGGAVTGFETFAAGVGNSNTTYYAIVHQTANEFEVGLGTLDGDSSDLTRTTVISSSNSDSAVDFAAGTKDVFCTVPASKLIFEDATNDVTIGRNLTVTGDLTVSGDDITMGTNTAGHIFVADGTNFNPVAVTDLSAISTIASGDTLLAVDASGGGLKKVSRSVLVAGLATSSALNNVSEDDTPQLGGNLDMNGSDIVTTSNATIDLAPNGTGTVVVRGNTNSGAIVFNCESNSHGQTVIAQPHSASVTNTMLLPAGASSTLVSLVSTDTLTNKTLTSPKINEDVAVTSTASELNVLDGITAVVGELNALDIGATAIGTAVASKAVILDSNKDYTGFRNITLSGELDAGSLDVSGDIDVDGTANLDVVDIDGAVNMATTATITGNLTLGAQLIMPDVTSTKMLVADGTSYQEVSISGDITIANTGAVTIAANAVEGSMLNNNTISGQTALTSGLATDDELLVSDGGTLKRMDVSVLTTLTDGSATALAIALG